MDKDIAVLQEQMKEVNKKIDNLDQKFDEGFDQLNQRLGDFIDRADQKYADKSIQRAVYWVAMLIIGAVIVALLALVIKNKQ